MVIKVNYMCYVNVTVIKRSNASIPNKKNCIFLVTLHAFFKDWLPKGSHTKKCA